MPAPVILRADARSLPLADNSVDLVVTSPPYFGLRSYQDGGRHYEAQLGSEATPEEFVSALTTCTREMVRVLKPSGSLWVNLGDKYGGVDGTSGGTDRSTLSGQANGRNGQVTGTFHGGGRRIPGRRKSLLGIPWRYALRCIDNLGLILRAEVIWSKPNALPESVTDRVRRVHETWFHFTLSSRYYSAVDEIREEYAAQARRSGPKIGDPRKGHHNLGGTVPQRNARGKLPPSVWTVATQPLIVPKSLGVDHFAAFPIELPRRIIKGWSPPSGVVLDPFGGTGTTALVAAELGRQGISVDASADYCRIAQWRCGDAAQRARVLRQKRPPKPFVPAPDDLFGGSLT